MLTRTGCKTLIELKKHDDEKWAAIKFKDHHNHELVSVSKVQYLRSHRRVGHLYGQKLRIWLRQVQDRLLIEKY